MAVLFLKMDKGKTQAKIPDWKKVGDYAQGLIYQR